MSLRDRARLVHVPAPSKSPLPLVPAVNTAEESPKTEETLFTSTQPAPPQTIEAVPSAPFATQPKVFIQFLVDKSFMTKYRTAIDVLSNRLPRLTFEAVFTALLDDFIRRNEPVTRHERRELAAMRADERRARPAIPVGTRDAVFARDLGRCTFVGSDGKRCNETLRLHVDHIKPVARGGTHDIANLRLLCARHNQLQAERLLGRGVMNGFRKRNNV